MDPAFAYLLAAIGLMIIVYREWHRRWFRITVWLMGMAATATVLVGLVVMYESVAPGNPNNLVSAAVDFFIVGPLILLGGVGFVIAGLFLLFLLYIAPSVFRQNPPKGVEVPDARVHAP